MDIKTNLRMNKHFQAERLSLADGDPLIQDLSGLNT